MDPSLFNQPVTFTATVTQQGTGNPITCGTVTFKDGATPFASNVPLGSPGADQAQATTSTLAVGNHAITADYVPGACIYFANTSNTVTQGVFPELYVTPAAAIFGASIYGGVSGSTVTYDGFVTARNTSGSIIHVGTVTAATNSGPPGALPPNFATTSDTCSGATLLPGTIPPAAPTPGSTCTIGMTFTASGISVMVNDFNGTLTVPSVDAPSGNQLVALRGTGVKGTFSATSAISFPSTPVGATSATTGVETVTNSSPVSLVINAIPAATGDFATLASFGASPCNTSGTTTLAPKGMTGASCTAGVTFTPTAQGTRTGSLTITSNFAKNSPATTSLKGTGTLAALTLNPGANQFGNVPHGTNSADVAVTLRNPNTSAGSTVTISGITTSIAAFVIDTGSNGHTTTCGSTLAPGAVCTIYVYFSPAAPATAYSGTLNINDNAGNGLQQGTLYGSGT
jgi:hypothetical protein